MADEAYMHSMKGPGGGGRGSRYLGGLYAWCDSLYPYM